MRNPIISVWLIWVTIPLIGCAKRSGQKPATTDQSQSQPQSPQSQASADSNPAITEGVAFLTQHFVISDNDAGRFEPTAFRASKTQVTFEFDNTDPNKPKAHYVESASATDLDPDSVHADFSGWLHVDCKDQKKCVSQTDSADKNEFLVGPVAEAYSEESGQRLKRILLLQEGSPAAATADAVSQPEAESDAAPQNDDPLDGAQVEVAETFVDSEKAFAPLWQRTRRQAGRYSSPAKQ